MIYLAGIVLIMAGIEMGARGVDEGSATLIVLPIYGVVIGIAETIRSWDERRMTIRRSLYFAIFVISMSILAATLHMRGVPYYWTGLPVLGICLVVGYFASRS